MVARVEQQLKDGLKQALTSALAQEDIEYSPEELPEIEVEVPREKEHGDYATNLALVMAGKFKRSPREVAGLIVNNFSCELVAGVDIAGPGFINFDLNQNWLYRTLKIIHELGQDYGEIDLGQGQSVQIEFVSANPTGPLHVGHSRGAVVGDVLANIMEAAGYRVDREYYINDAGNQVNLLGKSTLIRYKQQCGQEIELPENGYAGDYLKEIAAELYEEHGQSLLELPSIEQQSIARDFAYRRMLENIRQDLNDFGIKFDNWFSEQELHHQGKIDQALGFLREQGFLYDEDGATWFKASNFGDDKDRVVVKSDGELTYLAADIAYHYDKIKRGYDRLINIWGADHHGYITRVKAALEAFGYDEDRLQVLLVQMVTLLRGGTKVPMSKRAGDFVTMRDVFEEVGVDAARYFYIMRSNDSHLDFDLELAKEQSTKNPVYYIQYAHARIDSILEKVKPQHRNRDNLDLELLETEAEIDLMKFLARFPEEIKVSAGSLQPHNLSNYAYDLANAFHIFYNKCQVITGNEALGASRLYLVEATQQVLKNVLSLLEIEAPEQM
ncbi:MAG: arginine--tRNA ligase [Bacillota bacterium]